MVVRTGLYTTMGTMLREVMAPLNAVDHLRDPAVVVSHPVCGYMFALWASWWFALRSSCDLQRCFVPPTPPPPMCPVPLNPLSLVICLVLYVLHTFYALSHTVLGPLLMHHVLLVDLSVASCWVTLTYDEDGLLQCLPSKHWLWQCILGTSNSHSCSEMSCRMSCDTAASL